MAWCWGTFFIQAGLAVGNSGWVAFGEWLGADLEAAMGIAIIYIIIFGIMNLLSMRMYKWLINILFIVPFLGSLVTAGPDDVRQDTNFAALLKADGNDMGDLRNPIRKPFWDFVIVKNGKEGD